VNKYLMNKFKSAIRQQDKQFDNLDTKVDILI